MKRLIIFTLICIVAGGISLAAFGQQQSGQKESGQQEPKSVELFMRAKLEHSQKILEGLATENFDLIATHARKLGALSEAAAWQVLPTPEYARHSRDFRRSATTLVSAAERENLEGATLAYFDVTLKCVKCHQYVRTTSNASLADDLDEQFDRLLRSPADPRL